MDAEDLTPDEALEDIVKALGGEMQEPPSKEDGWYTMEEIVKAMNGVPDNTVRTRVKSAVNRGEMEKSEYYGHTKYYRAVKK